MEESVKPATLCAHAREQRIAGPPPLTMPTSQTSVWQLESLAQCDAIYAGAEAGYIYTRDANPNHTALEALIARLEGAEAGLITSTGMGAVAIALLGVSETG